MRHHGPDCRLPRVPEILGGNPGAKSRPPGLGVGRFTSRRGLRNPGTGKARCRLPAWPVFESVPVRYPGYLRSQSGAEVAVAEADQRCVAARENGG